MRLSHIYIPAALLAAVTLAGCAGSTNSPATTQPTTQPTIQAAGVTLSPASTEPIAADTARLVVFGMSCPLCANNVDKQLERVGDITVVAADLGTGDIFLSFDGQPHPTPAQLAKAVADSGYTLKSIYTN